VIAEARRSFVAPSTLKSLDSAEQKIVADLIAQSLAGSISFVMWLSCALALAAAACGAVAAPPRQGYDVHLD
jgi:hypothetical protein